MPTPPRPRFLFGLAPRFLLAAGLVALLGPAWPALAQSGRGSATVEPFRATGAISPSAEPTFRELPTQVPAGRLLIVEAVLGTVGMTANQRAVLLIGPETDKVLPCRPSFRGSGPAARISTSSRRPRPGSTSPRGPFASGSCLSPRTLG
jgi:hypothetical protein